MTCDAKQCFACDLYKTCTDCRLSHPNQVVAFPTTAQATHDPRPTQRPTPTPIATNINMAPIRGHPPQLRSGHNSPHRQRRPRLRTPSAQPPPAGSRLLSASADNNGSPNRPRPPHLPTRTPQMLVSSGRRKLTGSESYSRRSLSMRGSTTRMEQPAPVTIASIRRACVACLPGTCGNNTTVPPLLKYPPSNISCSSSAGCKAARDTLLRFGFHAFAHSGVQRRRSNFAVLHVTIKCTSRMCEPTSTQNLRKIV